MGTSLNEIRKLEAQGYSKSVIKEYIKLKNTLGYNPNRPSDLLKVAIANTKQQNNFGSPNQPVDMNESAVMSAFKDQPIPRNERTNINNKQISSIESMPFFGKDALIAPAEPDPGTQEYYKLHPGVPERINQTAKINQTNWVMPEDMHNRYFDKSLTNEDLDTLRVNNQNMYNQYMTNNSPAWKDTSNRTQSPNINSSSFKMPDGSLFNPSGYEYDPYEKYKNMIASQIPVAQQVANTTNPTAPIAQSRFVTVQPQRYATVDPLNLFGNRNGTNPFATNEYGYTQPGRFSGGVVKPGSKPTRMNIGDIDFSMF